MVSQFYCEVILNIVTNMIQIDNSVTVGVFSLVCGHTLYSEVNPAIFNVATLIYI